MPRSERSRRPAHPVVERDRGELLKRLNRISGQVEGIARMIAEDRYCIDIVTQIAAARSALDALGLRLLHDHAQGCVQAAVHRGSGEQAIEELMNVVRRFSR